MKFYSDISGTRIYGDITVDGNIMNNNLQDQLSLMAPLLNPTFSGTVAGHSKEMVTLPNVDNTSGLTKPISTATQLALNSKTPLHNPTFTGTVSGIANALVDLANVDNTSDLERPISTATQLALDTKHIFLVWRDTCNKHKYII